MSRQWHCWNCMARTGHEDEEEEQREENYVGNSQLMLSILNKKSSPIFLRHVSFSAFGSSSFIVWSHFASCFYVLCLFNKNYVESVLMLFSAAVIVDEVTNGCCWEMSTLKLEWDDKRRFPPSFFPFPSLSYRINTQFSAFFFFVSFCSNVHERSERVLSVCQNWVKVQLLLEWVKWGRQADDDLITTYTREYCMRWGVQAWVSIYIAWCVNLNK